DLRITRIRLSDKTSYCRPQLAMPGHAQLDQAQLLVQVLVGKALVNPDPHPVLVAQPPTESTPDVFHHRLIDLDHRTQTEVVGPANKHLVELSDLALGILQARSPIRVLSQAPTQPLNLLRRRAGADVLPA